MAKKILLADDSITIQKVVELTFSDGDFEVVAVNNGARAIQQLQESRPDIILSDIIMPEKNGYEVCEFVKSHPEYRTIPVVLLTGTFEPFDPDRAERAGCDAVVTKPFESQSLIHKVEELIAAAAPAAQAEPPVPESSPFDETAVGRRFSREMAFEAPPDAEPIESSEPSGSAFTAAEPPVDDSAADGSSEASSAEPFGETGQPTSDESFRLASDASPSAPQDPFDETGPPFPASSDAGQQESSENPLSEDAFALSAPSLPESGFGDLSEGDEESTPQEPAFAPPEPPAGEEVWSAATTAFPKMSFDDLRKAAEQSQSTPPQTDAEEHAWPGEKPTGQNQEAAAPAASEGFAWSAETTAIPKMSFADLQKAQEPEPASEPPVEPASLPWETSSANEPQEEEAPEWPAPTSRIEEPVAEQRSSGFGFDSPTPAEDAIPSEPPSAAEEEGETWPAASIEEETPVADDSSFASPAKADVAAESEADEPEPAVAAAAASSGSLSEADVDRIARRVVELLSDSTVREIAWEVIPDVANAIVRDRIRELESAD